MRQLASLPHADRREQGGDLFFRPGAQGFPVLLTQVPKMTDRQVLFFQAQKHLLGDFLHTRCETFGLRRHRAELFARGHAGGISFPIPGGALLHKARHTDHIKLVQIGFGNRKKTAAFQ